MMDYRVFLSEEAWKFLEREDVDRSSFAGILRSLDEDGDLGGAVYLCQPSILCSGISAFGQFGFANPIPV